MENTNEEIYFNFSYYALNLLGKQMYSNKWSAISELVANGIDAESSMVRVYINSSNQEKSIIEIFDDGTGMNYDDLANKYAYIGRNKRSGATPDNVFMGRKGVGKLAALFLAKKYYIITKNKREESSWILDSTNVEDSDMPRLERVSKKKVNLENENIWRTYESGTMIKLVDVDLTSFGSKRLLALEQRIANFYLLENLASKIEVAHVASHNEKIVYKSVQKKIAFKNFYSLFESKDNLVSFELSKDVKIGSSEFESIDNKRREVIKFTPSIFKEAIKIEGKKEYLNLKGEMEEIPFKLEGWIGIHSSISLDITKENDTRFLKNNVYIPNRLRLYVRNKLAVANFLDILENNQAFANYIEGEISFDVLDDDRLQDISTTNREGLSDLDGRVTHLKELVKPIVNRLISDRARIGKIIKDEENEIINERLQKEKEEKERERLAKEREREQREYERLQKEREQFARIRAEERAKKLSEAKEKLEKENKSLDNQNKMKDVLLGESEPDKQKLFAHELTGVSRKIDYALIDMVEDFYATNEYDRIKEYVAEFKNASLKLNTINQQFLKLNTYDIAGKQDINLMSYLKSYFAMQPYQFKNKINYDKLNQISVFEVRRIELFDLGVLLDNIISNAIEREATYINVDFSLSKKRLSFTSNTGPINLKPVEKVFDLGVSTKENGTGIGMFLVKEISKSFGWGVSIEERNEDVSIIFNLGAFNEK